MTKTPHFHRIDSLMEQAGQARPNIPTVPDEATRLLRAKLIFEEAIRELLYEGLGVNIRIKGDPISLNGPDAKKQDLIVFETSDGKTKLEPNLVLIADGCADTSVVTIGTLVACGIDDKELLELVDNNNLAKFGIPKCDYCNKEMVKSINPENSYYCLCSESLVKANQGASYSVTGGYRNKEGKWIKPSNHRPPDIAAELERQKQEKLAYLNTTIIEVDEATFQPEFPDMGPNTRRMYIGSPKPDPRSFIGEFSTKAHRDSRIGRRVKYSKKYHGNEYTSGTVIGSGDEAPIAEPAKHGEKYLVIDDDVCFDTLWILESEVTFVD